MNTNFWKRKSLEAGILIGVGIKTTTYVRVMILYLSGDNKNLASVAVFGMN